MKGCFFAYAFCFFDPGSTAAQQDSNNQDSGQGYQLLLQQREEENRQEVERLTAEIRALKLQLLQLTSKGAFFFLNVPL